MTDAGDADAERQGAREPSRRRRVLGYARRRPDTERHKQEIPTDWCAILDQNQDGEYPPPGLVWLETPQGVRLVPMVWLEIRNSPGGEVRFVEGSDADETILLVDDDLPIRAGLRRLLEKAGYQVLTAATAHEAIERAADHEVAIHLLITDFMLSGANGQELAEVLIRGRPGLRVLYMSGYEEEEIAAAGEALPGRAFLQKPFSVEAFLRQVRDLLDPGEESGASLRGA